VILIILMIECYKGLFPCLVLLVHGS
jgi:hypothetical protein